MPRQCKKKGCDRTIQDMTAKSLKGYCPAHAEEGNKRSPKKKAKKKISKRGR